MAYLFDTDAISEVLKPRPLQEYIDWLGKVPREEQFTSAVVIGELYKGAYRSPARERHLANIDQRVRAAVTILPYDVAVARLFGEIGPRLEKSGVVSADADLQIAATAIYHGLELVTGNVGHFQRVPGLKLNWALADARRAGTS